MLKKLLFSLVALVIGLSASAETRELWRSDTDEGVLVDWGKAAFALTPEQAATEVNIGDTFTITVTGVTEGGWPQVCICNSQDGGWGTSLANAGVGGKDAYPYEASFQITGAYIDKIRENGLSFGGNGAYVTAVSVTPAPFEFSPYAVWFGPKTCNWGDAIGIGKEVFANVAPGDKIQVVYDKDVAEHTLQFLFGGWGGANIATYQFGGVDSFSDDGEAGVFTLTLTPNLSKLIWEEKEYDLFSLLKEGGLVMQGPCTVKQILYIPSPFEVSPYAVWIGPKTCNWGNGVSISKDVFAEVATGDKIQVYYDKDGGTSLQFLFGGWSGANVPTYEFGKYSEYNSFSKDETTGCFTVELTEALHKLTQEVEEGEETVTKEYDVFALLREDGLIMHGPCTINQVVYIPASAEPEPEPEPADPNALSSAWWHQWDGFGADAQIIDPTKGWVDNIGKDLNGGDFIIGNSACDGDCYADLTDYAGIEGVATPGITVRFYFNRAGVQGAGIDIRLDTDAEGNFSYLFKNMKNGNDPVEFVHLTFVKIVANGKENPRVESIKVIPKPDPIVEAKEELTDEIVLAKLYDSFAKTEESFAALQTAISAAEAALNAEDATVESLATAKDNIKAAIDGLTLEEGYTYLTAEMFKHYASVEEPGEGEATGCAYDLFKSTNTPYGDGNVSELNWADLAEYDKFIITMADNEKPRVMMNRMIYKGDDGDSKEPSNMLEMQPGKGNWSTNTYTAFDSDNKVFSVDLKSIVKDYGFARLNAIKYVYGGSGIVTGMYLYISNDELELPLENLSKEIEKAEQCDRFLKTEESLQILDEAIAEGKAKLEEKKPTVESVEAATAKIAEAIAGLTLKPGYSELTKDMFKHYDSVEEPGEGTVANGNLKLFETVGVPFGTDGVDYLEWAELTDYDQLIVKTDGNGGKPRFLMNRLVDGGQQGSTMENSNMLDITFGEDTWSAKEYAGCEDNVYSIDLNKIIDDYGFARLNTMKSKGGNIYVTGIYLFKDPEAPAEYTLGFDIDDPSHVVIKVDGEQVNDLKAGSNEVKVADRAKLSIAPAESFILKSVTANDEDAVLKEGSLSKTIVKAINFSITTDDADPLAKPKKALTAIIESAKLYDSFAKTEESWKALESAITAAESELENAEATEASLNAACGNINKAIEGLTLVDDYCYLTPEMFKQHASVEDPGEGEETDCAFELFNTSRLLYGVSNNGNLKWADLSEFDQLILTTLENTTRPRFCMNNEVADKFEINPYGGVNEATEDYQTIEGNRYVIDLKKIVKDHAFAHLHSIEVNDWGTGIFVTGMYLYKNPIVEVTGVTISGSDNSKPEKLDLIKGEEYQLSATVAPEDATDKSVTWTSSKPEVATVDETGLVKAVGGGSAVITVTSVFDETITASLNVNVTVPVNGISLDKADAVMTMGEELKLVATVDPSDATEPTVTWKSSDENIATVVDGNVKALAVGKVTITATSVANAEKSASCAVKVYPRLGDADWNGKITTNDAVDILNYVVEKKEAAEGWDALEWKEFYLKGANANKDEDINISVGDACAAVELALAEASESTPSRISGTADEAVDALVIGGVSETSNGFTVPVALDNSMPYVALQADIFVPEGMSVDVKAGSRVADSHTMMTRKHADNHIRVAIFNFSNSEFAESEAPMFEILTNAGVVAEDIVITNILASDSDAHEYVLGARQAGTTGVAAIGLDANAPVKVFDINGMYVSDTMVGLQQGTYVVRQGSVAKKVIIR